MQALALHAAQCTEPNGFVFGYVYYVYGTPGGRAEGGGRRGSAESQSPEGGAPSAEGPQLKSVECYTHCSTYGIVEF